MVSQDPFIGREIGGGQFKILQKIGSGGMGAVYKAEQPEMNRMVAVKILHPKLASRKDLAARFRREARAMSHLSHPNTARIFLYGELEDDLLYIVMEFLEGKNLNQIVRSFGPLPLERALPILIQACGALEEAHRAGIIHRDLKPENIFISQQGGIKDFVKVLDFGLAKVTEREMRPGSIALTQEGMVFGTPEFMSPEQAQGLPLTPASDIYSLAVILYEVLTGKLPFDARTSLDFLQMHVSAPPIRINERVAGKKFPESLQPILDKALAKRPRDRCASAIEFAHSLEEILLESATHGLGTLGNGTPVLQEPVSSSNNPFSKAVATAVALATERKLTEQSEKYNPGSAGPPSSGKKTLITGNIEVTPIQPNDNSGTIKGKEEKKPGSVVASSQLFPITKSGGVSIAAMVVIAALCIGLGALLTFFIHLKK